MDLSLLMFFSLVCTVIGMNSADDQLLNDKRFPPDFIFGVGTSAFQIEGAWNVSGKSESVWDFFIHNNPGSVTDGSNGDIACDSYYRYKEDVAMLKEIGVSHYRFSLAWTRILPKGTGVEINKAGITYYKNLIKELIDNNITPIVTINHWEWPQSLQEMGGIKNSSFANWFSNYAEICFREFGDEVEYWMTFNEPSVTCSIMGFMPPLTKNDGVDEYLCIKNILLAHAAAWHVYDDRYRRKQKGRVSIGISSSWYQPASDGQEDEIAADRAIQFNLGVFAHPLYEGDFPEVVKIRIKERSIRFEGLNKSRLPDFTQEEVNYIRGTNDFFSLSSYVTKITKNIPDHQLNSSSNIFNDVAVNVSRKVHPLGLRKLLNWINDQYSSPEILIKENGIGDETGNLNDIDRIKYLKKYISSVRDAMVDGVNVIGYCVWSFMDNMEWIYGYTKKYGLVHVDFNNPNRTRTRKRSSYFYERLCRTKCLVEYCEN